MRGCSAERVTRSRNFSERPLAGPQMELNPGYEQMIASWPQTLRLEITGIGKTLFCHATPRNDTEVFTRLTPEDKLLPVLKGVDSALVVCGYTPHAVRPDYREDSGGERWECGNALRRTGSPLAPPRSRRAAQSD